MQSNLKLTQTLRLLLSPILTQTPKLLSFSLRHTVFSHFHSDTQTTPKTTVPCYEKKEPVHSYAMQALAGGTISAPKPPSSTQSESAIK